MQERALAALRRLWQTFTGFSTGQKAVTISVTAVLLVGGLFFYRWASQPSYGTLFSNLSSTDASAIVDKLSGDGVPYKLSDGGQTIQVPQAQVYDLRLKMSGEGLPKQDDTGYTLLDKQGITTSDFMQHVGYQRALEGELATTIKSIEGVSAASVHLALPEKDVFTEDAAKPTASVLVTTQSGQALSNQQVQAVVNLVGSSVTGMDPANVTVADSTGKVLSSGQNGDLSAAGDQRTQQTQAFENQMGSSIQQMLGKVLGQDHAAVKVTADLDFDKTESKTQRYVNDPKVPPLSSTRKEEAYTGGGTAVGGVLGPDNIQVPAGGNGNGNYKSATETRDNAVGTVTETRQAAPGQVRKLNVAVLVDGKAPTAVQTAEVEQLVSAAAGLDTKRGDTIQVSQMPFDQTAANRTAAEAATAAKAEKAAQQATMLKTGGAIAGIVVLALLAGLRARRRRRAQLTPDEMARLEEMQAALDRAQAQALESAEREALPAAGDAPKQPADSSGADREALRGEISDMVERQPEEVAQLLRGWLADRRS
ncbi:flagellar basal-body MS-ring/collar protein FliF [Actinomadura hibisca]|uniref:flagellar basal-body MS-ring/collar protein FliF n=1 Tax=Actinomadura hibisca TaxID=68565 RepID=UPI000836944F|nr:flagellar basal-body MS-ring/collar protein FliF [Actinomadura hibisca]